MAYGINVTLVEQTSVPYINQIRFHRFSFDIEKHAVISIPKKSAKSLTGLNQLTHCAFRAKEKLTQQLHLNAVWCSLAGRRMDR